MSNQNQCPNCASLERELEEKCNAHDEAELRALIASRSGVMTGFAAGVVCALILVWMLLRV